MKFKKPLIKLLAVGSLFFMFSLSFSGVVSLNDNKVNNFWTLKKLDISFADKTYAESGGGDDGGYRGGGERNEGGGENERGGDDGRYTRPTPITRPTPAPINNPTPISGNNTNTQNNSTTQTCKTVYDTVSTASGSTVQEPREVCTNNKATVKVAPVKKATVKVAPVKKATVKRATVKRTPIVKRASVKRAPVKKINIGLSTAEKVEIKSQFDKIYTKIVSISSNDSQIQSILNKISDIITTTINKIQNKINYTYNIDLKNKYKKQILILQDLDSLVFDKKTGGNIINNILNQGLGFTPIKHVAPIGSTYTIIQASNGKYTFKRENGTYTNKSWNTPNEVIAYIDKNAVPATNRPTIIAKPKPVVVSRPRPIIKKSRPVVKPKPIVISKPRPAPKPKPKPAPKPAPVINTTTTAS